LHPVAVDSIPQILPVLIQFHFEYNAAEALSSPIGSGSSRRGIVKSL
jgi:hypothetical protein